MKYSKYFGYMTRNNGQPHLELLQFQRMMNIISVEGIIQGLMIVKEKLKDTTEYYRYDVDILKYEEVLNNLTNNLDPETLYREMLESNAY